MSAPTLIFSLNPNELKPYNSYIIFSPDIQSEVDSSFCWLLGIEFAFKEIQYLDNGLIRYSFDISKEVEKAASKILLHTFNKILLEDTVLCEN